MFGLLRRRLGKDGILWSINRNLLQPKGLEVRKRRRQGEPPSLISILLSGSGPAGHPQYAASDPRDIIFGLLGVISDADELSIHADYGTSAAEVFTTVTKAYLRQKRGMDLLGYSDPQKDLEDLPSWVPDWSRIGRNGLELWPITYNRKFKSSLGHSQPEKVWVEQRKLGVLCLAGVRLGKVASVQLAIAPQSASDRLPKDQHSITDVIRYCDDNEIKDMGRIIRTCLMDKIWIRALADTQIDSVFISLAERVFRGEKSIDERKCSLEEVELLSRYRFLYKMDDLEGQEPSTQTDFESFTRSTQQSVSIWLSRRRLFVTDDGQLGLGRPQVAVGDLVTIIFGYEAPIVIHPIGDGCFSLASDAYVDGVMYGEVVEGGTSNADVFEIV